MTAAIHGTKKCYFYPSFRYDFEHTGGHRDVCVLDNDRSLSIALQTNTVMDTTEERAGCLRNLTCLPLEMSADFMPDLCNINRTTEQSQRDMVPCGLRTALKRCTSTARTAGTHASRTAPPRKFHPLVYLIY